MKKSVFAVIAAAIILLAAVFSLPSAANDDLESEFEIENGILKKYNGSKSAVEIPEGVYIIGDGAFEDNTSLVSVDLSPSVYSIGNRAFYGCTALETVGGTESITQVGAFAFENTALLTSAQEQFVKINNVLIAYNGGETAEIPNGIIAVAPYAFAENTELTSVTVPNSVISIGEGTFYGCTALEAVSVSDKVLEIGALAFAQTKWLSMQTDEFIILGRQILVAYNGESEYVEVKNGVEQISGGAFYGNSTVREIKIPSGCAAIQIRAFADCENLQLVTLPKSIAGIDPLAFENSDSAAIAAENNSFAHRFAENNGIPFISIKLLGDVNGDGKINAADAVLVLQYFANIIDDSDESFSLETANINGDESINAADAAMILQVFAGIIT